MDCAKSKYGRHVISVSTDTCQHCGLTHEQIMRLPNQSLPINFVATTATSVKPSQPTTQAPQPQSTRYTSIRYSLNSSADPFWIQLLHSDPTPELPPFDPTIGETGETVWGEVVEVIGKTFCTATGTEYHVKVRNPAPGSILTYFTHTLRRPKAETAKGCQHTWVEYMGFTERYQFCSQCDEKWRG